MHIREHREQRAPPWTKNDESKVQNACWFRGVGPSAAVDRTVMRDHVALEMLKQYTSSRHLALPDPPKQYTLSPIAAYEKASRMGGTTEPLTGTVLQQHVG